VATHESGGDRRHAARNTTASRVLGNRPDKSAKPWSPVVYGQLLSPPELYKHLAETENTLLLESQAKPHNNAVRLQEQDRK